MEFGFDSYLSPFTWRYASSEMRGIFSEKNNRLNWRRIWVALAKSQKELGLVTGEELKDLEAHWKEVDITKSLVKEKEIRHDLMAELLTFSGQCKVGGGKIHLGATSMDIEDNAEVMRQKQALMLIEKRLSGLLFALSTLIKKYADFPCLAFTHLQPAEPTTIGYRFTVYAQDFYQELIALEEFTKNIRGKGMKGAVGTSASYLRLSKDAEAMEDKVMNEIGLKAFDATGQTYPRTQDYELCCRLSAIAASLHKMAFDFRVLQSPMYGELSEPFKEKQVGSSAMPFKRNPISAERICSLSRLVSSTPQLAWDNAANSLLERTLDDSANKRVFIPEAFLALDECLMLANKVLNGLSVNLKAVEKNLDAYAPFSATEPILLELVQKGLNRQEMHELLREYSMQAWKEVQEGKENPLKKLLSNDTKIKKAISPQLLNGLFNVSKHTGNAGKKAAEIAASIDRKISGVKIEKTEAGF